MADNAQPIKIAILAMGGEGGGVLADWVVATAHAAGYPVQATSIPGVAQRTGARAVLDGTIPEDLTDWRPGRRTAAERRVRSPLAEPTLGERLLALFHLPRS